MEVTNNDKPGWHRVQVEASPFEDYVFNYDSSEHGDFDQYMSRFLHGSALAPVERQAEDAVGETPQNDDIQPAVEETSSGSDLADFYADAASDD